MTIRKLTHPGNILLMGFGAMLIMMSVLVYLSVRQDVSLVNNNYYEQELHYQGKLDAMNNTNIYDSQFSLHLEGDRIVLQVPAQLSARLQQGTIDFYCPANETLDKLETLAAKEDGIYTFERSLFPGKKYIMKISFISDGKAYYKEMKLD